MIQILLVLCGAMLFIYPIARVNELDRALKERDGALQTMQEGLQEVATAQESHATRLKKLEQAPGEYVDEHHMDQYVGTPVQEKHKRSTLEDKEEAPKKKKQKATFLDPYDDEEE